MMTTPLSEEKRQPGDTAFWADEARVLKVVRAPTGALNLNVEGHQVLSPLQGFGQLWQNVYKAPCPCPRGYFSRAELPGALFN